MRSRAKKLFSMVGDNFLDKDGRTGGYETEVELVIKEEVLNQIADVYRATSTELERQIHI